MSWNNQKQASSDDGVRDSWEELADEMMAAEAAAAAKPEKKPKKKSSEKKTTSETAKEDPVVANGSKLSSSPDFGKVRILKRDPTAHHGAKISKSIPPPPASKTYEERVQAYNEARMRIFGCLDDDGPTSAMNQAPNCINPGSSNPPLSSHSTNAQNYPSPSNYSNFR